jgi:predicted nucleic acid-binding Zn ribbon protein
VTPRPRRAKPPIIRWCGWCGETLAPDQSLFCNEECAEDFRADVWREARQAAAREAATTTR